MQYTKNASKGETHPYSQEEKSGRKEKPQKKKFTPHNRQRTVSRKAVKTNRSYLNLVPKITIDGKWLREAGFAYGDKIDISVSKKKLIITNKEEGGKDEA